MASLTGNTLGSYRILEQIGRGGMATVYKAYQPSLDRYIAVKILPPQLSLEPGFSKRFGREARSVAKLEHPHILAVHDFGQEEDLSYIVMPYVDAGTLKDLMGQPLHPSQIADLIGQIAEALDHAHQHGIVHRDIKPSNVLLDRGEWVLLTDFGLARMMESSEQITATGVGVGTPDYMSPEQGKGEKFDHRSDVYSLGIVLYEMLTGRVPFHAETPMAVVLKHIYEPLPLPREINPEIPEGVERVVLKALAKAPNDRHQTAGDLAQALQTAIQTAEAEAKLVVAVEQAPGVPIEREGIGRLFRSEKLRQFWWLLPVVIVIIVGGVLLSESMRGYVLYDDFDDQEYDGTVNEGIWLQEGWRGCGAVQQGGSLIIANEPTQDGCEVRLVMRELAGNQLDDMGFIEAQIRVSEDHSEEIIEQVLTMDTIIPEKGSFYVLCGIVASYSEFGSEVAAFFEADSYRGDGIHHGIPIEYDRWYTFRIEVETEEMRFSCFVDGELFGSMVPTIAEELREASFEPRLQAWRSPGSYGTTYVDNVRISP